MLTEFFDYIRYKIGAGLPRALTTTGNLKVSIEENTAVTAALVTATVTATVAEADPTLTAGVAAALSLTTAGRLRIDTEAGTRDFDGVPALYVGDRVLRRQAEQAQLDAYLARMQSIIATEWESSQRMGFEVR